VLSNKIFNLKTAASIVQAFFFFIDVIFLQN